MHRTEGLYNDDGLFTDGPPGTNIEQNWCNAVQEELCYVIEQAGITLDTAGTETRTQLKDAINVMISGAGGVGSLQALDCNLNANKEIIPTVDSSDNLYLGTVAKTFALLSMRAVNIYEYADNNVVISGPNAVQIESDGNLLLLSTTDNTADCWIGNAAHSFATTYMVADVEVDIDAPVIDIDASNTVAIDSVNGMQLDAGTTMLIESGSTMTIRSDTDNTDDLKIGDAGLDWKDIYIYVQGDIIFPQITSFLPSADNTYNLLFGDSVTDWLNIAGYATTQITWDAPTVYNNVAIFQAVATNWINLEAANYVKVDDVLLFPHRNSDPAEPADAEAVIWVSTGAGKGDQGDVMVASRVVTTKYGTLFDQSGGAAW